MCPLVARAEFRQDLGHDAELYRLRDADHQLAGLTFCRFDLLLHAVVQIGDTVGIFKGNFPRSGGNDPLFRADVQLCSELLFQRTYLLTDGGLR